jgi:hypothetical protein
MFIMQDVKDRKRRARRSFTVESQAEIIKLCRSMRQVAKDSDLTQIRE